MDEKRLGYMLLVPALTLTFFFLIYPMFYSLAVSFFRITGYEFGGFVGLGNYADAIVNNQIFAGAVTITFYFVLVSLVIEFVLGLGLALILNTNLLGMKAMRWVIIVPMMMTPVVVGLIFRLIYSPEGGVINEILGYMKLPKQNWLADPSTALNALIVVEVWQYTPFMALVLLAGLQTVSPEMYEAAAVDGASRLQLFRHITIPFIRPVMLIAIIFSLMRMFKTFDIVVMVSKGGPGYATILISYYIQQVTYRYLRISDAAAMSQLLMLIVLIIGNIYIRYMRNYLKV